jgi:predicted ATPase/DNA-binding CsgD family transcriptional regulator
MSDASRPPRKPEEDGPVVTFPRVRALQRLPHTLPLELTSFVGREKELAEVKKLLADHRLLTLTGPGGGGKTRLALAVANDLVESFEDGVWWVELASLSDPDLVPQAVASTLGVREAQDRALTEALSDHLGSKEMVLVLDNCEHLVEGCAALTDALLRACPELRILATSREALGVAGERAWVVPSLSLPDPDRPPAFDALTRYEAVRLFVERARSAASSFRLTERNAPAVAKLCHRLDGVPLAIELAAARARALSVDQIVERLEDPLGLLTVGGRTATPRHRTLRATLQWSHDLLSGPERKLFRRLSAFLGGWTLESAEAVCSGDRIEEREVLDLLSGLVDKSLVVAEIGSEGAVRYGMLEPVRQYGYERLEESGESEAVSRRHAEHYLALAEEAEPELKEARQGEWLERLEREHGNLRTALAWSTEGGDAELGLRLAGALERLWWARGYLSEGRRWLERGLAGSDASPTSARAKALSEAGWMALWQDDLERAVELLEEGLGSFKDLGDEPSIATSLTHLGHAVLHQHDKERLKGLCEEAEALREGFADRWAIAELLVFLGMAALYEGDHERAVALLEESMTSFRDLGDTQRIALCVTYLWMAALEGGDHERAAALLDEDLRRLQRLEVQPQIQIYDDLMGSAVVAALGKRPARAARLRGAAEALREAISLSLFLWDHTPTNYEDQLAAARSQLDEAAWEAAWSEGRAMTPEQAVEYALSKDDLPPSRSTTSYPAGLSAREAEVLKLVARGLTNAQIAAELFISPRTVDRHLNSIYRKVGISSRAAATRFAAEHNVL